jgi:5-hydroxyisourate hydrolase-like protein (transthyretin family)
MKRENYTLVFMRWLLVAAIGLLATETATLNAQCNGSPACGADTYGLSEACRDTIRAEHLLTNYNPSCTYTVVLMRNGLPSAPIVTGADVGQSFMYMVNIAGGGGCSGNILIEDKRPPVIVCPSGPVVVPCGFNTADLPRPTGLQDCSAPIQITGPLLIPVSQNNTCNNPLLRTVTARWTVFDRYNNQTTCDYLVQIMQANPLDITAPADTTLTCGPGLNLTPGALGVPTINGVPFMQNGGFCNLMMSDPEDKVITICGNARVINRTWQIMNMCDPLAPPTMVTQAINIIDLTAPVASLPTNQIQVNALSNQCVSGIINLPSVTITEQCSPGSVTVFINTPVGVLNSNGGSIAGVPAGVHIITYQVSDPCGNSTSATLTLTVQDNTPPNPICRTYTTVTLNNFGVASAPAHVFNNGSSDNCGPVFFKVARMSGNSCDPNPQYDDSVPFCCADIPDNNIMVILRVYDVNPGPGVVDPNAFPGRYNSCMVEVEVQDKLRPTVTCPSDITVDCLTDLNFYLTNEVPISVDNCGENMDVVVSLDSTSFNVACKTGFVTRTLTYTDLQNTIVCTQRITLDNISMPGGVNIVWPEHFMGQSCGGSVHPDSLPAINGRPIVTASLCGASIGIGYEDMLFQIVEDACFKVIRTWRVMNWCTYNPNTGAGLWTFHQTIKVLDNEEPVIAPRPNVNIFVPIVDDNCSQISTQVNLTDVSATDCTPEQGLRYRYRIDFNSNGTYESGFQIGKNASGIYPVGNHRIQYIVDDMCGNTAAVFQNVSVQIEDGKAPTPVMKNLSTALMPGSNPPMVTLQAVMFNSGSFDNCTSQSQLRYAFSNNPTDVSRTFFCEDVPLVEVDIYVFDEAGNSDFVTVELRIRDEGLCPDSLISGGLIYGKVISEEKIEIESVRVELENSQRSAVVTGSDGAFMFDRLNKNNFYRLAPAKNTDPRNGISTLDILLIQRHILGITALNSPYKILAADANRNGQVSASDLVELQRLILGKTHTLAGQDSWMFVDEEYIFPDPTDPFSHPIPSRVDINQVPGEIARNFIGIKVGDVNNTASMNSLQQAGSRTGGKSLDIHVEDKTFEAGEYLYVPFKAGQFIEVEGFQATMQYNADLVQFLGIANGELKDFTEQNAHHFDGERGMITMNWFSANGQSLYGQEPLFYTRWIAKSAGKLSDVLSLNSAVINNEAYHQGEISGQLQLVFEGKTKNQFTNKLMQNKPNPFNQETTIAFELADAGQATITIMDLSGKTVWRHQADFSAGMNEIRVQKQAIGVDGIYLYRLDSREFTETKRMILVNN